MAYIRDVNSINLQAVKLLAEVVGTPPAFENFLRKLRAQVAKAAEYADAIHAYGSSSSQGSAIATKLAQLRDGLEDLKVQLNVCRA